MREKSLSAHRDYGDFTMVFIYTKSFPNTPKVVKRAWRTRLKNINSFGEHTSPCAHKSRAQGDPSSLGNYMNANQHISKEEY